MPSFGTPSHIDLSVSDVEASATWYCKVLDLNQHSTVSVARFDDRNVGLDHVGFSVSERADLDAWEKQLTSMDVVYSPDQDTANGAALVLRDPDDIQLEFCWTRGHCVRFTPPAPPRSARPVGINP